MEGWNHQAINNKRLLLIIFNVSFIIYYVKYKFFYSITN